MYSISIIKSKRVDYMYVCVRVCLCVYDCAFMSTYVFLSASVRAYVYVCECVCVCVCVYVYEFVRASV